MTQSRNCFTTVLFQGSMMSKNFHYFCININCHRVMPWRWSKCVFSILRKLRQCFIPIYKVRGEGGEGARGEGWTNIYIISSHFSFILRILSQGSLAYHKYCLFLFSLFNIWPFISLLIILLFPCLSLCIFFIILCKL